MALAYNGLCTFEFGCVAEVFALRRSELDVPWYRFEVCAHDAGPLRALGGILVQVPRDLSALREADTIVVPGWRGVDETPPHELLEGLRAAAARGARMASICSGVFVLAAAGLLDGKRATTHWRYADILAERFPAIELRIDSLYVDEGQFITAAGSAAGLDMLLHLVQRDHGARIANRVAQRLVLPTHRLGDQAQFVRQPLPRAGAGRLSRLQAWLLGNLHTPVSLDQMAERAALSPRSLQRKFLEATGLTPMDWLHRARIEKAKGLLESADATVSGVASECGYETEVAFRRQFRRLAGVSPVQYRRQFLCRV